MLKMTKRKITLTYWFGTRKGKPRENTESGYKFETDLTSMKQVIVYEFIFIYSNVLSQNK